MIYSVALAFSPVEGASRPGRRMPKRRRDPACQGGGVQRDQCGGRGVLAQRRSEPRRVRGRRAHEILRPGAGGFHEHGRRVIRHGAPSCGETRRVEPVGTRFLRGLVARHRRRFSVLRRSIREARQTDHLDCLHQHDGARRISRSRHRDVARREPYRSGHGFGAARLGVVSDGKGQTAEIKPRKGDNRAWNK